MDEISAKNMTEFKESFNMLFGTTDEDIDLFDNPYITFKVYEVT